MEIKSFIYVQVVICSQHEVKNWILHKRYEEQEKSPHSLQPKLIVFFLIFTQEFFNQSFYRSIKYVQKKSQLKIMQIGFLDKKQNLS